MRRQAITFDFHNTLVRCDPWFDLEVHHLPSAFVGWHERHRGRLTSTDAGPSLDRAYRRLRNAIIGHGHELSAERSLSVVLVQAGIHVADATIQDGVYDLMNASLEQASAVPGAVETVRSLADAGIPLGVVSSAVYHPFLDWALERLEIHGLFSAIVTSAGCGFYKSRPEIYWSALGVLNADPERSIHVGDSARYDVDGAANAGMRTVWLSDGASAQPVTRPDLHVSTLTGVVPSLFDLLESCR